jgi:CRP-like cAMP-binding protein
MHSPPMTLSQDKAPGTVFLEMSVDMLPHRQNRILSLLPHEELDPLAARLEPLSLDFKQVLYESGEAMPYVYFPISGVVSWLALIDDRTSAEVATIGHEGMVGVRAFLGADTSPARVMVQVPGPALRLKTAELRLHAQPGSSLVQILNRYLNAFLTQITQSVACNTFHSVEKRFCRWLLMTHDRVRSDHFPLTHELAAQMLGVRRASVTEAARKLQTTGLIRYTHGKVSILDRQRLESASCGCYRAVKADYDNLLPGPVPNADIRAEESPKTEARKPKQVRKPKSEEWES